MSTGLNKKRPPPGVKVQVKISAAKYVVSHIASNLLRRQTVIVSWEDSVKVEVVDRRGAATGF
jgi:hypothetical protein